MPTARGPAMTGSRCASSERPCVPSEDRVCPGWEPGRPGFMTDSTRTGDPAGKTRDQLIMEYAPLVRGVVLACVVGVLLVVCGGCFFLCLILCPLGFCLKP